MLKLDQKDHDCGCGGRKLAPGETLVDASITCLACGHAAKVSVPMLEARSPLEHDIFKCEECGAHMAYGRLAYREVVEPYVDDRGVKWVRRRFQDPRTKEDLFVVDVDRERALSIARELLALVTL